MEVGGNFQKNVVLVVPAFLFIPERGPGLDSRFVWHLRAVGWRVDCFLGLNPSLTRAFCCNFAFRAHFEAANESSSGTIFGFSPVLVLAIYLTFIYLSINKIQSRDVQYDLKIWPSMKNISFSLVTSRPNNQLMAITANLCQSIGNLFIWLLVEKESLLLNQSCPIPLIRSSGVSLEKVLQQEVA